MKEIFKPRENMIRSFDKWQCYDATGSRVCDGGPSLIWDNGDWHFYISGIGLHRLDGPASSIGTWYIRGDNVTEEIHAFAKENNIDLDNLSDEDKVLIALKFG